MDLLLAPLSFAATIGALWVGVTWWVQHCQHGVTTEDILNGAGQLDVGAK